MKCLTRLTKSLQKQKSLLIILLTALNQATVAQETGYWDDRLRLQNYDGPVSAIAVKDSNIFIERGNSAIMWNGMRWDDGPPAIVNRSVIALAIIGNDLYVGGNFTTVGSKYPLGPDTISANNIAKWNFVTKSWSALENNGNNGVNGPVRALVVIGNDLYVGGEFSTASGIPVNNIVKINTSTGTWMPLGKGVNGRVRAIAVSEGELYVGGSFTSAGGVLANNIAKWDGREWSSLGSGVNHLVNAIAILGRDVYVGGYFTKAGDVNANYIAKWNTINKSWSTLGSGAKNGVSNSGIANVYAIATTDRATYIGGTFSQAGEQSANNIAKWDPVNNTWSPLGSGVQGQVFALVARGNEVFVGGGFTYAGGKRSDRFAIWHEPPQPENRAPAWRNLPDVTFQEEKKAKLNLNKFVSDVNDTLAALTFRAEVIDYSKQGLQNSKLNSSPAAGPNDLHITINPTTHVATFSASKDSFGIFTVVFTVADPLGLSDSDTIQVTVTPVNDAPVIAAPLPGLTFGEDDSLLYPIRNWHDYVTDVDDADSTLAFKVLSGKRIKAAQRTESFLFTAPPNWFGTSTLKLIAKDRGQLADTATFAIKVKPVNDAPVISGLPDSLSFRNDAAAALQIWDFVEDVETPDSLLNYAFAASKDSLLMNFNPETGTLRLQAPDFSGLVDLFMTVTDDQRATVHDTIAVQVETTTSVAASDNQIPTEFVLFQNYPNPFNPTTLIRFGLPHATEVRLEVYDLSGRRVATLLNERKPAGYHAVELDARNLSSGTYFYRLTAGRFSAMKKLMLLH